LKHATLVPFMLITIQIGVKHYSTIKFIQKDFTKVDSAPLESIQENLLTIRVCPVTCFENHTEIFWQKSQSYKDASHTSLGSSIEDLIIEGLRSALIQLL
jgi:hypothetical protein